MSAVLPSIAIPRTVAARKPRRTSNPVRRPTKARQLDHLFPVAREVIEASSDARRAAILLRLPDAVVVTHGEVVAAACREIQFDAGVHFLGHRLAVLHATRLPSGALPDHCTATLEIWRSGMAALAGRQE